MSYLPRPRQHPHQSMPGPHPENIEVLPNEESLRFHRQAMGNKLDTINQRRFRQKQKRDEEFESRLAESFESLHTRHVVRTRIRFYAIEDILVLAPAHTEVILIPLPEDAGRVHIRCIDGRIVNWRNEPLPEFNDPTTTILIEL